MAEVDELKKKIIELENRIKELETELTKYKDDQEFMDALYEKAKELVLKYNKSSVIFLQKKLIIDYVRASRLVDKLKANGVI